MGLALLPQMSKAQVYDEEKRLQWRSMETGPLEFEPRFYYWLFHNSYAHHEWEWEWHGLFHSGFYLNLKPHKSDAKPLLPKRTLGAATDEWTRESTDAQEKNFKHQLEQETLAAADRRIDAAYLLFKDDFDEMQQKISAGLTYCMVTAKAIPMSYPWLTASPIRTALSRSKSATYIRAVTAMSWRMPNGKSAISS